MAQGIAVIIRFSGDADELLDRFERARQLWIDAQDGEYEPPLFYAACRTDEGIAIVTARQSALAHRAFGQQLHPLIAAVGINGPDRIERFPIRELAWG